MRYKPLLKLNWVQFRDKPPFNLPPPKTRAQKKGVSYEQKVHDRLSKLYGLNYVPSQWVHYGNGGETHWAQFDGLLFLDDPGRICLLEVKYSHTAEAYWQLENCYLPLARRLFAASGREICVCEIVKWYDCAVSFPCTPILRDSLLDLQPGEFSVHILNRD